MKIDTKQIYTIKDNVKYYDSKVEDKIAYTYGLYTDNINAYIVKLATGLFNDCQSVLSTQYMPFLNFVNEQGESIKVFENYYPEVSAYITKTSLYSLTPSGTSAIYWDNTKREWTTILDYCTFFFTNEAADIVKKSISNDESSISIRNKEYKIKYLVVNCGIDFPCSSFQSKNMADYID